MNRIVHITEETVFYDELGPDSDPEEFKTMMPGLIKKWDDKDFSKRIYFRMDRVTERGGTFQYIKAIKPK
jgi:hypothetical protein